jgi:hypothetical protein
MKIFLIILGILLALFLISIIIIFATFNFREYYDELEKKRYKLKPNSKPPKIK